MFTGKLIESENGKKFLSPEYNFVFDKKTGFFARWGKTEKDDPDSGLPEILDIEVTTICNGIPDAKGKKAPCKFCYKSNTSKGENMTFETFKKIFDKLPKTVTQIAFGADAQSTSNPDLFEMMKYARTNGIIPNITVADVSDEVADKLVEVCGAVAVSAYFTNTDICYNSVEKLSNSFTKF